MRIKSVVPALLLCLISPLMVGAQELQVISVASAREALTVLGPEFTKDTTTKVTLTFGNSGAVDAKMAESSPIDVVVTSDAALEALAKAGLIKASTSTLIWNATIGLAVRAGAPVPDISTPAKLRSVLLAAKSIAYNDPAGGTAAGPVVARVLKDLGIADQVATKTKYERPAAVASGAIELNMTPISELIAVQGITIVGPLPAELKPVTAYGAAVATRAAAPDKALAFVKYLARPESIPTLKAKGLAPLASGSGPSGDGVSAELARLDQQWQEAVVKGDTDFIEAHTSETFSFTYDDVTRVDNKAAWIGRAKQVPKPYQYRKTSNHMVEVHGDVALILGRMDTRDAKDSCNAVQYVHLWEKHNNQWMFLSHRTTRLIEPSHPCTTP